MVCHLCELGSPSLYAAASMNLFPQWEQLYDCHLIELGSPSLYAAASMNLFPQWEQLLKI